MMTEFDRQITIGTMRFLVRDVRRKVRALATEYEETWRVLDPAIADALWSINNELETAIKAIDKFERDEGPDAEI